MIYYLVTKNDNVLGPFTREVAYNIVDFGRKSFGSGYKFILRVTQMGKLL